MPIRIDNEVHEWLSLIKEASGSSSISETMRRVILRQYPDIRRIAEDARLKEGERRDMLLDLARDLDEEG